MATAYKYVEREVDSQVNWAEVGKNLTNTLKEENRIREEKKSAIDAQAREYYNITNDVPLGENTELNKFALNGASDLQEQMMLQHTLLKSGQLQPRQYTIMMQNLTDGTDQAFSLFENYNAEYSRKMAMMDPNLPTNERASKMQSWQMEQLEGFGNFKNSKLIINPNSGILSMAKMIPDPDYKKKERKDLSENLEKGVISQEDYDDELLAITEATPLIVDKNQISSVQTLENRLKATITQYDVIGAADTYLDSLGVDKRAVIDGLGKKYKSATIRTITDATAKEKGSWKTMNFTDLTAEAKKLGVTFDDLKEITLFSEAQDNWIKGQLGVGGTAAASVLLDFKSINQATGEPYTQLAYSEENQKKANDDSNIIIMKQKDGRMVPSLSKQQQEQAERILKTQINVGVDYEAELKTAKTGFEKTQIKAKTNNELEREDNERNLDSKVAVIGDLWGGSNAEVKTATDFFRDQNDAITDVSRTPESLTVTYLNENGEEESRSISFYVTEINEEGYEVISQIEATQADVDAGAATSVGEMINQRKTQKEFIKSAGPLLTNEDNIDGALERGSYDSGAIFNEKNSSTSRVITKEKEPVMDYTLESVNFVRQELKNNGITLTGGIANEQGDDVYVAEQLNRLYREYGLTATAISASENQVKINVPGFKSVIIDTNNYSASGVSDEMEKLENLILLMIKKNEAQLAKENNWKGQQKTDKYGVPLTK